MEDNQISLTDKITSKSACVAIVGMGYVGLPLSVAIAQAGFKVTGIDLDKEKVSKLNDGESYISDIETPVVRELVKAGLLSATTDFSVIKEVDIVSICVPTPLSEMREPDISYVRSAANEVAKYLKCGQLIILESTTYPGTTEEIILPILEESGLTVGKDFYLAFSPERVDPGNKTYGIRNTPKIVGGVTQTCTKVAEQFYGQFIERVVPVSSTRAAEMTKLLENIFRCVNIALVNELMLLCDRMDINIWEVIDAASTKPFGFMPFFPGPGLGGHCLAGSEVVFTDSGSGIRPVTLEGCFDELKASHTSWRRQDVDIILPDGVKALSFDINEQEICYKPVKYLFRRRFDGEIKIIRTEDGRKLEVTDLHPMIVFDGDKFMVKPAKELAVGDLIPIVMGLPAEDVARPKIDLIEHIPDDQKAGVRVRPINDEFSNYKDKLTPALRKIVKYYWNYYSDNSMPLAVYLKLENLGVMPVGRGQIYLTTGRGSSFNKIKALIDIDEDIARLIGYYLAEGHITEDKSLRTRFIFNANEQAYIEDVTRILSKLGLRYSFYKPKRWNALEIKVSSNLFGFFIRDILGCGANSYEMKVPSLFFSADEKLRAAVISGMLRGDGDVYYIRGKRQYSKSSRSFRHHINAATVGYFSASPALFQQAILLLQSLGFSPTFKKGKPYLRLYDEEQLGKLLPYFTGSKQDKLLAYRQDRRKKMSAKRPERYQEFSAVKVKSIKGKRGGVVYSIEVGDTHTFVTSFGIVTHNCIPIDPFYLSWKARQYDFHTEFIELAGKTNESIPYYVVSKVSEALNSHEKSIKGSNILILGIAYKKDIGDTRESPALKIIALLEKLGAQIAYHDPYVAEEIIGTKTYKSVELTPEVVQESDCVLIVTDHSLVDYSLIAENARLIVDTRNKLKNFVGNHIIHI